MPKSKTRQELASEYGMSRTTFYRTLKRLKINLSSGLVPPIEQKKIYEKLGRPDQDSLLS